MADPRAPIVAFRIGFAAGADATYTRPAVADEHWLLGFDTGRIALHRAVCRLELVIAEQELNREIDEALGFEAEANASAAAALVAPIRPPPAFTCPRCGASSWNPNDAENRYCGRCHAFVDDQEVQRE